MNIGMVLQLRQPLFHQRFEVTAIDCPLKHRNNDNRNVFLLIVRNNIYKFTLNLYKLDLPSKFDNLKPTIEFKIMHRISICTFILINLINLISNENNFVILRGISFIALNRCVPYLWSIQLKRMDNFR